MIADKSVICDTPSWEVSISHGEDRDEIDVDAGARSGWAGKQNDDLEGDKHLEEHELPLSGSSELLITPTSPSMFCP